MPVETGKGAGGCSQPSSKQSWQPVGVQPLLSQPWSRCLAAWFSGNINLVLPWLQELLRHGARETHVSRGGEQFLPWLVLLRRSRSGTGFVVGSLRKSILVLAEECFFPSSFLSYNPFMNSA